jgi:predicted nucleotide-binding protein
MNVLTANELKTKGISAVEAKLEIDDQVIVSVRGHDKYVIMDIEKYAKLREYELTVAILEAKTDLASGNYIIESVADHMKRVKDDI